MARPKKNGLEKRTEVSFNGNLLEQIREVITTTEYPAYVSVKLGRTIPLKTEYATARIDVSISMPCNPKDVDKTFDKVRKDVEKKIVKVIKEYGLS